MYAETLLPLCMRGGIHTEQKCPICGANFKHDEKRRGLYCPEHKDIQASSQFIVCFGRKVRKRFKHFHEAERFLTGLRYEVDKGSFDVRDYLRSNPLSFTVLSNKYLEKKKPNLKESTYIRLVGTIKKAQVFFGNTNVKKIGYAEFEDFIDSLNLADKTKHNYISVIKAFYNWLYKRREIKEIPEFPVVSYELGFRKTIDKETQIKIINEIKLISYHVSPKIWLGIKWLSTYISIRPGEMLEIKEGHIDRKQGLILIPHPKEKKPKLIPLISEDIQILNKLPVGLPEIYFFRHGKISGVEAGTKFGEKLFYKWWKKACKNLEITGVDLYGGTRHSSAVDLRKLYSPEQIKRSTMHSTNKAFERYFQISRDELENIYSTASGKHPENESEHVAKDKILK